MSFGRGLIEPSQNPESLEDVGFSKTGVVGSDFVLMSAARLDEQCAIAMGFNDNPILRDTVCVAFAVCSWGDVASFRGWVSPKFCATINEQVARANSLQHLASSLRNAIRLSRRLLHVVIDEKFPQVCVVASVNEPRLTSLRLAELAPNGTSIQHNSC